MIVGIGVDIVRIERMRSVSERLLERLYTEAERAYCESYGPRGRHERYAGRFAAKEAVAKALGTGISQGVSWTDLEILPSPAGSPRVELHGAAKDRLDLLGGRSIHLSISHDKDSAVAMVVLEGAGPASP